MIVKAFTANGKWFGVIIDDDGSIIMKSGPEYRVGCAIRSALNLFERGYGKPTPEEFTMDIGEW